MVKIDQQAERPIRRKASKEVRRRQLIESTIDSIAARGFAATTMADVADGAGLSRGIVNFHFESKEKLLAETLRFMSDVHDEHWRDALRRAGPDPAAKMWGLLQSVLDRKVCNRRYISAWAALSAEGLTRPIYKRITSTYDAAFTDAIRDLCQDLVEDGGYDADAELLAVGLDAMLEGLWLHILLSAENINRKRALAAVREYLVSVFPKHFTKEGTAAVRDG